MRCLGAVACVLALGVSACGGSPSSVRFTQTRTSAEREQAPAGGAPTPTRATLSAQARFDRSLRAADQSVLAIIERRDFRGGVWDPASPAWQTGLELADVAAILGEQTGSAHDVRIAELSINTAIRSHQAQSGAFMGDTPGEPATYPSQFATGSALVSLGTAYMEIGPQIGATRRAKWRAAISRAAFWLSKDIHFYVNGNINLQGTLGLYLAWRATHNPRLWMAYNSAWAFALHPGRQWPGRGLKYSKPTSNKYGLGGAGYLSEQGRGAPGFDPHYTTLQSDYVAELYAVSHATRAVRLLNLLVNQLFTRIDTKTLMLSTGGGSRDPRPSENEFISASLPILAFSLRPDLIRYVRQQETTAAAYFSDWAKTANNQSQIVGNYAMALLLRQAHVAPR